MRQTIVTIIAVGILVGLGYLAFIGSGREALRIDTSDWETYRSDEFDFELKHPADWEVRAFPADPTMPRFNVVRKGEAAAQPITHHSDVAQVSVFPFGIPTEGISGETRESSIGLSEATRRVTDFVLEDGSPWATFVSFTYVPGSWTEAGFVFARALIAHAEVLCLRDNVQISDDACDPLKGDLIVRRGQVNSEERAIEEAILASFMFLNKDKSDLIRVDELEPGAVITSPLSITGEARGYWFFEGSFPVHLVGEFGEPLATAIATAEGEWMTEEFVPFRTRLTFDPGTLKQGTIVFQKDNPSGLPEHADSLRIPITLDTEGSSADNGCVTGGCSGQLCVEEGEEIVTTCEYRREFACYQNATCERQATGSCGWTSTPELTACLEASQ